MGRGLYRLAPGAAEAVPVCVPVPCALGCSEWRKEFPSRRPKRLPRRKQQAGQQYGDGRTGPFFAGDTVDWGVEASSRPAANRQGCVVLLPGLSVQRARAGKRSDEMLGMQQNT